MIVWWVSAIIPRSSVWWRGLIALAICFSVELSQLYRAPWLEAVRGTAVGHLVLGSDFFPRDFVAYACGVLAGVLLDRLLNLRTRTAVTS
jgi:hypothetical protein